MPLTGAARYTSQLLTTIKRHRDKNTLIVGDLNTPLSAIDRAPEQKTNIETRALNAILDELDLIDIYRTLHSRTKEYSFYSNDHGTFSRLDHVLGHKTGLNRYQKTEIIPCIFSDHNALKLELNHKEKFGRNSNTWRLRTILLRNDSINQEIKNQFKQFMETNENENTMVQNLWDTAKAVLRGKYIAIQASLKRIE